MPRKKGQQPPIRPTQEQIELARKLIDGELDPTLRNMAELLGTDHTFLGNAINAYDPRDRRHRVEDDIVTRARAILDDGRTVHSACKELGVSYMALRSALARSGYVPHVRRYTAVEWNDEMRFRLRSMLKRRMSVLEIATELGVGEHTVRRLKKRLAGEDLERERERVWGELDDDSPDLPPAA